MSLLIISFSSSTYELTHYKLQLVFIWATIPFRAQFSFIKIRLHLHWSYILSIYVLYSRSSPSSKRAEDFGWASTPNQNGRLLRGDNIFTLCFVKPLRREGMQELKASLDLFKNITTSHILYIYINMPWRIRGERERERRLLSKYKVFDG